jgi:hypothetical protein
MAVSHASVTVATSAIALNTAGTAGQTLYIFNGSVDIFLGASDVTTSTGVKLAANGSLTLHDVKPGDTVYAISGSSSTVAVLSL